MQAGLCQVPVNCCLSEAHVFCVLSLSLIKVTYLGFYPKNHQWIFSCSLPSLGSK